MPRKPHADSDPASSDPLLINDPGNEDPGSLLDDALVPLLQEPEQHDDEPESED
ncbi:hypothetical protein J4P02_10805 [Pseudomonas sp. NFXW11]|uniref:hypothetical protein n=1 Tax=Pseudomonas sp. NFXW11 TaxID=2819531 RepID=UPI003CEAC71C